MADKYLYKVEGSPCPFCGGMNLELWMLIHGYYFIYCATCLAQGPIATSKDGAIEQWKRAEKQSPKEVKRESHTTI